LSINVSVQNQFGRVWSTWLRDRGGGLGVRWLAARGCASRNDPAATSWPLYVYLCNSHENWIHSLRNGPLCSLDNHANSPYLSRRPCTNARWMSCEGLRRTALPQG
jgi:hypothetical protein